jgi:short subunit dehydrogenase-like uncharacterized protein
VKLPSGKTVMAVSFPGGEVIQVPAHVQTRAVIPLMTVGGGMATLLSLSLPLLRVVMASPIRNLVLRQIEAASFGPTPEERAASRFTIVCEARHDQDRRVVIAEGRDPYGLTAVVAVALASYLLTKEARETGAVAPSMIAGPELIVEATRTAGVSWLY